MALSTFLYLHPCTRMLYCHIDTKPKNMVQAILTRGVLKFESCLFYCLLQYCCMLLLLLLRKHVTKPSLLCKISVFVIISLALDQKSDLKDAVNVASALALSEALPWLGIAICVLLQACIAWLATAKGFSSTKAFGTMKRKLV